MAILMIDGKMKYGRGPYWERFRMALKKETYYAEKYFETDEGHYTTVLKNVTASVYLLFQPCPECGQNRQNGNIEVTVDDGENALRIWCPCCGDLSVDKYRLVEEFEEMILKERGSEEVKK